MPWPVHWRLLQAHSIHKTVKQFWQLLHSVRIPKLHLTRSRWICLACLSRILSLLGRVILRHFGLLCLQLICSWLSLAVLGVWATLASVRFVHLHCMGHGKRRFFLQLLKSVLFLLVDLAYGQRSTLGHPKRPCYQGNLLWSPENLLHFHNRLWSHWRWPCNMWSQIDSDRKLSGPIQY